MNSVRLLTANLFKEGATPQALDTVLSTVKPDILAVQELTAPLIAVIEAEFPYHRLSPLRVGSGIGLAARRPVFFEDVPMPHRPGVVGTLHPEEWPEFGGPVEVLAVHLINPIELPPWTVGRIRRGQVHAIASRATSAGPRRVVCGDLNATPIWPAYRTLMRHYRDGILEAETGEGRWPARTWAPLRMGPRLLRIDHVLISGLTVTASRAVRVNGSDHLAVSADLVDGL